LVEVRSGREPARLRRWPVPKLGGDSDDIDDTQVTTYNKRHL